MPLPEPAELEKCRRRAYFAALERGCSPEDAEDLAQEALVKLLERPLGGVEYAAAYTTKIAGRAAVRAAAGQIKQAQRLASMSDGAAVGGAEATSEEEATLARALPAVPLEMEDGPSVETAMAALKEGKETIRRSARGAKAAIGDRLRSWVNHQAGSVEALISRHDPDCPKAAPRRERLDEPCSCGARRIVEWLWLALDWLPPVYHAEGCQGPDGCNCDWVARQQQWIEQLELEAPRAKFMVPSTEVFHREMLQFVRTVLDTGRGRWVESDTTSPKRQRGQHGEGPRTWQQKRREACATIARKALAVAGIPGSALNTLTAAQRKKESRKLQRFADAVRMSLNRDASKGHDIQDPEPDRSRAPDGGSGGSRRRNDRQEVPPRGHRPVNNQDPDSAGHPGPDRTRRDRAGGRRGNRR